MFRIFFLYNRKLLLRELSRCAWKAIRQYFEVCSRQATLPAGILSIATAGDFLNWNPHIHAWIASGSFTAAGSYVPAALFAENVLRELFEAQVYKLLVSRELIGPDLIAKTHTWKHSGFHVYVGPSIVQKEDAVRVGLYIVRAPAAASRLQLTGDGLLKYLAKGSIPNDRCDSLFEPAGRIFDYLEWIAKVTSHIPEKGAQLVHYYGTYSNAHRGKKAKSAASEVASLPYSAGAEESETDWIKLRRKSWAALIRLVYESDPLLCPKCGTQMNIVSVIQDGAIIDKSLHICNTSSNPCPLPPRGLHRILLFSAD